MKAVPGIAVLCCLLWTGLCFADVLVIRFRSGKTQQVTLDEPANAIEGLRFEEKRSDANGPTSAQKEPQNAETPPALNEERKEGKKEDGKAPGDKKGGFRLKWAPPKLGD